MQDVTFKNIRKRIKGVIFGGTFLLCKIQNHVLRIFKNIRYMESIYVSFTLMSVKISRRTFFLNYICLNEKRIKKSSIPFSSSRIVVSLAELDFASSGASPVVSESSSLFGLGMVRGKKKTKRDTTRAIVPNMRKPSHQAPIQRGSLGVIVVASKSKKLHACS